MNVKNSKKKIIHKKKSFHNIYIKQIKHTHVHITTPDVNRYSAGQQLNEQEGNCYEEAGTRGRGLI